jgi:four helix bundle protein
MAGKGDHKKLDVWQRSIDLCVEIYRLTETFPASEKFGLVSQMRRASVSVASNIAEGAARGTTSLYVHFLTVARGSLAELDTQMIIASRLSYISAPAFEKTTGEMAIIGRMLTNLVRSLQSK